MLEKISNFFMVVSFAAMFLTMIAAILQNGNLVIVSILVSIGVLPLVIIFSDSF